MSYVMLNRELAIKEVSQIIEENNLAFDDIANLFNGRSTKLGKSGTLAKIMAILGGIFIFSGIAVYVAMFWDDINSTGRILVTFGVGFALHLSGIFTMRYDKFRRA